MGILKLGKDTIDRGLKTCMQGRGKGPESPTETIKFGNRGKQVMLVRSQEAEW